jgi:putative FmdB family regulatory protein
VPLYDYQCRKCNEVTEVRHGFKESFEGACPQCGGEMARVFNPAGIVFKGSGFYITDSRKGAEGGSSPKSEASAPPPPPPPKSETAA